MISGTNSRTRLNPAVPAYVNPALIATLSAPCQLGGDQVREIRLTPTIPVTPEIETERRPLLRRAVTGLASAYATRPATVRFPTRNIDCPREIRSTFRR